MKNLYLALTAGLLLSAATATAQTKPAAGPLQAAQRIALSEHAMLAATVSLPNHNMVLLLTDAESFDITAQCLAPDGHTVWKTGLKRFQRRVAGGVFGLWGVTFQQSARYDRQLYKDKVAASLYPVDVFTDGNRVVLAERLNENSFKKQNKDKALKDGQTYVQRLDEQGRLQAYLFDPRPGPESKKTEALTLGRYAEATGYTEVVRETNKREESLVFAAMHYDLGTHTVRREVLELPATPEHVGGMNSFRHWYQEWAYLGHRPNQTYFCRRTLTNASEPKQKAGNQPIVYQVHIADDQGGLAGGFSTTLGLNKNTKPMFSGYMPSPGEMNHIPNYFSQSQGRNRYVTYDEWEISSGGIGSFYLDYRTGDVLVYGEYGEGDLPEVRERDELLGFFERRFAPDGHVVAQMQSPYSEAMKAKKKKASFQSYSSRSTRFHLDPLTGQQQFSFAPVRLYGNSEDFDLFLDQDLKPLRYDYLSGKDKDERTYTSVLYTQPFKLATTFNSTDEIRLYEHTAKDDHPVYAALEKRRRTAPADAPDYWFHLCPTGPTSGLVVEQNRPLGGSLQVYTFQ